MKSLSECIDIVIKLENSNHALGVFSLMQISGAPEFLQYAGLFHSIYETSIDRKKVQTYIGKKAEEIVFLFCQFSDERIMSSGNKDLIFLGYINSLEKSHMRKHDENLKKIITNYEKLIKS